MTGTLAVQCSAVQCGAVHSAYLHPKWAACPLSSWYSSIGSRQILQLSSSASKNGVGATLLAAAVAVASDADIKEATLLLLLTGLVIPTKPCVVTDTLRCNNKVPCAGERQGLAPAAGMGARLLSDTASA